jgi:hypothetical protein
MKRTATPGTVTDADRLWQETIAEARRDDPMPPKEVTPMPLAAFRLGYLSHRLPMFRYFLENAWNHGTLPLFRRHIESVDQAFANLYAESKKNNKFSNENLNEINEMIGILEGARNWTILPPMDRNGIAGVWSDPPRFRLEPPEELRAGLRRLAGQVLEQDDPHRPWFDLGAAMGDLYRRYVLDDADPEAKPRALPSSGAGGGKRKGRPARRGGHAQDDWPDCSGLVRSVAALSGPELDRVPLLRSFVDLARGRGTGKWKEVIVDFLFDNENIWEYGIHRLGYMMVGTMLETLEAHVASGLRSDPDGPPSRLPVWYGTYGRLRLGDTTIRTFRKQAKSVYGILDAFQARGWPRVIDDPLSGGKDCQRLHGAVRSLNKGLRLIHFQVEGGGKRVRWKLRTGT